MTERELSRRARHRPAVPGTGRGASNSRRNRSAECGPCRSGVPFSRAGSGPGMRCTGQAKRGDVEVGGRTLPQAYLPISAVRQPRPSPRATEECKQPASLACQSVVDLE